MKKLLLILGTYLALVFIACLAMAFLMKGIPPLLDRHVTPYKIQRGIRLFLDFLPAICLSGFTVAGTIAFAKDSELCNTKFSPQMVANFKSVMICALIIVLLLTFSKEVFNPVLQRQKTRYMETPLLLEEYLEMGEQDFKEEKMLLAYGYAKQATKIDPNNARAKKLLDDAQGAIEALSTPRSSAPQQKSNEALKRPKTEPTSTYELIRRAMSAYEKKNYFDAHYYADLAVKSTNKKNINYETAKQIRSNAWNALAEPVPGKTTDQNNFYREKQEAYTLLMNGNNLEAYYKFLALSKDVRQGMKDPDIIRFLGIAKDRLDEMYFFIEETEDLAVFENSENVYFKLPFANGKTADFQIRGVTTVKETGRMIQYLRGIQMTARDESGKTLFSMGVPYAKMLVLDTANLDESAKEKFSLSDYKQVPYLMLESVSRSANIDVISPTFFFEKEGSPEIAETTEEEFYDESKNEILFDFGIEKNFMILPMPCSDFNKICDASFGIKRMDLISLFDLSSVADKYGYSWEVYNSTLVNRCTYPLEIMILVIFCAILAWGYRLRENQFFKFSYVFILPVASIVFYFVLKIIDFIFQFLTFALVCYCGEISLLVAIVFWIFILIALSINFLSHKN